MKGIQLMNDRSLKESSFRRNVVDNRIETDAFSKGRVTLKEVNQLPYCKTLNFLNEDSFK